MLGIDFADIRYSHEYARFFFTGPVDEYFGCRFGRLPYRSLAFRHEALDREWLQPAAVVNYADEHVTYTRITEYKHLTGQGAPKTSITNEYPCDRGVGGAIGRYRRRRLVPACGLVRRAARKKQRPAPTVVPKSSWPLGSSVESCERRFHCGIEAATCVSRPRFGISAERGAIQHVVVPGGMGDRSGEGCGLFHSDSKTRQTESCW